MRWPIRSLMLLVLCVLVSSAAGYDFITSRAVGLGQGELLSHPTASEFVNLPAGGFSDREWRIETGFNRAYDLADFNQFFIAGGYRRGRYSAALGFSQFGKSELYAEQVAKGSFSMHFDSITIGLTGSALMVRFGGNYANLNAATIGLGGSMRFRDAIAAISIDNLTSPKLWQGAVPARPQFGLYGEFRGKKTFSLVSRALFEKEQAPRFSLGQRVILSPGAALLLGISTEPLQYGGGLEIGVSGGLISYNAAYHPVLGLTQTIAVSYGKGHKAESGGDGFK